MARIKFQLDYIVPDNSSVEDAIEMVKKYIEEDGLSSAINEDNVIKFSPKTY